MRPPDLSAAQRDLLEWSQPLIADRVSDFYAACFDGDQDRLRMMKQQHCYVWRNLLLQDCDRIQPGRRQLVLLGKRSGIDSETLDQIDEAVLDELAEIIAVRFHRSAAKVRDYSRSLIRVVRSPAR